MSSLAKDVVEKNPDPPIIGNEIEDNDLSRLPDKSNIQALERKRSCDERSLNELSLLLSSWLSPRKIENIRNVDNLESTFSSRISTPRSQACVEPHPMISEAWEALRRSLVYFRGQPVGTIAALDHTEEALNYNQVYFFIFPIFLSILDKRCVTRIVMKCYPSFCTFFLLLSRSYHCLDGVLLLYIFVLIIFHYFF